VPRTFKNGKTVGRDSWEPGVAIGKRGYYHHTAGKPEGVSWERFHAAARDMRFGDEPAFIEFVLEFHRAVPRRLRAAVRSLRDLRQDADRPRLEDARHRPRMH
jgi:hypothetical protein